MTISFLSIVIIEIFVTYIEIWILFCYYDLFLKARFNHWRQFIYKHLLICFLVAAVAYVNYRQVDPYLILISFVPGYAALACLIYQSPFLSTKKHATLPIAILYFFNVYCFSIMSAAINSMMFQYTVWRALKIGGYIGRRGFVGRIAHMLLMKGISFSIFLIIKHVFFKRFHIQASYLFLVSLACTGIFVNSIFSIRILMDSAQIESKRSMFASALLYLLIQILLLYLSCRFTNNTQHEKNEQILKVKYRMLENNYNNFRRSMDKYNKILHERKNTLLYILNSAKNGDSQRIVEYVEKELCTSLPMDGVVDTGSQIVDLVLQEKNLYARERGVFLQSEIQRLDGLPVHDMDICSILSNLLDNAIEACSKVDKEKRPSVYLTIKRRKAFLSIRITNTIASSPVNFVTQESSKEAHGYGLQIVKECVEKYNGNLQFECLNDTFIVYVLLCLESREIE